MSAAQQTQQRRRAPQTLAAPSALALRDEAHALAGGLSDPQEVTKRLREALTRMNLIAPSTSVGTLPLGCEVSFSTVLVDKKECYSTGGSKLGLSKVALDRIASAAGISWDARRSGRTDDGSDPRYCAWRAVGTIRNFDGTEREIVGSKEMDLREGSSTIGALRTRYEMALERWNRTKQGERPKDPSAQINEQRLHIMAHAETKARLRAIRSIGMEAGYTEQDLEKPFVIARLQFTGRVPGDPELERAFALKQADMMLGATKLLYGGTPEPIVAVQHARLPAPPPVGTTSDDEELPAELVEAPKPAARAAAPQTSAPAPSQDDAAEVDDDERPYSGLTIPFGRERGVAIEDASDAGLQWVHDAITEKIAAGTNNPRFRQNDDAILAAIEAEMEWRAPTYDDDAAENQLPDSWGGR